jgi:hypothetical protein
VTLGTTTFSRTTLSRMTLSIETLRIRTFSITIKNRLTTQGHFMLMLIGIHAEGHQGAERFFVLS